MKLKSLSALTLGAISIAVLAACGPSTQGQRASATQAWHDLVACARAHGDPTLPDPRIDSNGQAQFPSGTVMPSAETRQACQTYFDRLPATVRNGDAPNIPMGIKFAQCMREHGLTDWPDPNGSGEYSLPSDLQTTRKSGPVWDRIHTAWNACRAFNPSGQINIAPQGG